MTEMSGDAPASGADKIFVEPNFERVQRLDAGMMWRNVVSTVCTRLLVLGTTSIIGLLTTREVITAFGAEAYAQYGLLATIPALLPFLDLGISAAVINIVAQSQDGERRQPLMLALLSSSRILVSSSAVTIVAVVGVGLSVGWPSLLGGCFSRWDGNLIATACLVLFAFTIPLGLGERILVGLRKNQLAIMILSLQAPLLLGLVVLTERLYPGFGLFVPLCFFIAAFIVNFASLVVAIRLLGGRIAGFRGLFFNLKIRGSRVMDSGLPMMLIMIVTPIGLQSDRLVLSHVAGPDDLAAYTLAAQVFLAVLTLAHGAGMTLWPLFAHARARGDMVDPIRISMLVGLAALFCCLLVAPLSSWIFGILSDGRILVSTGLTLAFSTFVILYSVNVPLGMYLTDPQGLRFQARCVIPMVCANLPLSIWLVHVWGAAGPIAASAVVVGLFQVLPYTWRTWRRAEKGNKNVLRHDAVREAT